MENDVRQYVGFYVRNTAATAKMTHCFIFNGNQAEMIEKQRQQQQQNRESNEVCLRALLGLGLFKRDQIIYNCVPSSYESMLSVQWKINENRLEKISFQFNSKYTDFFRPNLQYRTGIFILIVELNGTLNNKQ